MAKCKKCGRKGLFFKVNFDGLCKDCEALIKIEKQKQVINNDINVLCVQAEDYKKQILDTEQEIALQSKKLQELENNYQKIYDNLKQEAEQSAIKSIQNEINSLKIECDEKTLELNNVREKLKKISLSYNSTQKKLYTAKTLFDCYKRANSLSSGETYLGEEFFNKYIFKDIDPTVELKLNCMNVKQLRSLYNQNKKLIQDCLARYEGRYNTKTNAALYKLMTIALEAELQNILYSINYGKLEAAENSVKEMTAKYFAIAVNGNQHIAPTIKKFIAEIEYLFLEAVKIEYEYFVQKERIKEEQRALREQMRQEAEERKQLEAQRKQVEKEESKYYTEMQNVKDQIENTADAEKIAMLESRLAEIQAQLDDVEQKKSDIIKLQNGKAGYVYVISNLGSFGDNVFKVGMTRRLEPMDRVKELGDASVPFPFDVHSFIFSDDAVNLERTLHVELNERRVNKINLRKEFFRISVDELEEIVYRHQPTAEFNRTMLAEQYNQSLSTDFVREELIDFDSELFR